MDTARLHLIVPTLLVIALAGMLAGSHTEGWLGAHAINTAISGDSGVKNIHFNVERDWIDYKKIVYLKSKIGGEILQTGYHFERQVARPPQRSTGRMSLFLDPQLGQLPGSSLYIYVIPGFNTGKGWSADDHWHVASIISLNGSRVIVDADLNGLGGADVELDVPPYWEKGVTIGVAEHWRPTLTYNKPVLVLLSDKPLTLSYNWLTNDWGIYDETSMFVSSPLPSVELIGYGKDFYITTVLPGSKAKVYVNGNFVNEVSYGKVIELHYEEPKAIRIESDKPVVAVTLSFDRSSRDKVRGAPLVPPAAGDYWIPPSFRKYYSRLGASQIEERCLVFNKDARIAYIIDMEDKPRIVHFDEPVAVLCYRKFEHQDPWASQKRTALSLFPVYGSYIITENETELAVARPQGPHGGAGVVFVGSYGETHVYIDYEPLGGIDKEVVLNRGEYLLLAPEQLNKIAFVIVKGPAYVDMQHIGAWERHADTLIERANTIDYAIHAVKYKAELAEEETGRPTTAAVTTTVTIMKTVTSTITRAVTVPSTVTATTTVTETVTETMTLTSGSKSTNTVRRTDIYAATIILATAVIIAGIIARRKG